MHQNKKYIDFKHQEIYRKEKSFDKAMRQLCNAGFLKKLKNNNFYDEYRLTLDGLFLVEDILNHFIISNRE